MHGFSSNLGVLQFETFPLERLHRDAVLLPISGASRTYVMIIIRLRKIFHRESPGAGMFG